MKISDKKPLVSIIIPVYNGSDYLGEATESALNQTYPNIEVLVVNDGSTDNGKTKAVAESFGNKISYFEKANGGVASAFNYGIERMKGYFFSWLSHDDVYLPEKVSKLVDFYFSKDQDDKFVFSDTYYIDANGEIIENKESQIFGNVANSPSILYAILTKRPLINGNTVLFPKKFFDVVGMFNEKLKTSQDYDLWFRLALIYPFMFLNKRLVKTRIHANQGSSIIKTFIKESNATKLKQIGILEPTQLISLNNENRIENALYNLSLDYLKNGGDKSGWPANKIGSELLRKKTIWGFHYYCCFVIKKYNYRIIGMIKKAKNKLC